MAFSRIHSVTARCPDPLKYEEAIYKLNSLQSNKKVLEEASKRIMAGHGRSNNIETTKKYLKRAGINISNFDDRVIHITGTKGKSSSAMLTESLLRSVPYRTGLFVSPHVTQVRERISINGKPLSHESFVDYFWQVYNPLDQNKEHEHDMPHYFKFLVIMALKVFISEKVDVAVIEVGIGGELDCTNVFERTPVVGVTSIGLDHISILGDTEEKIAWEKAGIFKPGCRALTVPGLKESVFQVLKSRALEKQCLLEIVPRLSDYSWNPSDLSSTHKINVSLALNLAKAWQVWTNNSLHKEYDRLSLSETEKQAVRDTHITGRCHVINDEKNITYYLDGAHTTESVNVAKEWFLANCPVGTKRVLIFNVTTYRPAHTLLELLKDCLFNEAIFCSNIISCKAGEASLDLIDSSASIENGLLIAKGHLQVWLDLSNENKGTTVPTVSEAIELIQKSSTTPTSVLVTGSLHLVGSVLHVIQPPI